MQRDISRYINHLDYLNETEKLRYLRDIDTKGDKIEYNGKEMLNLSSNDYLGLGFDDNLVKEFERYLKENDIKKYYTSASSRLLTGNHLHYETLEINLLESFEREAALVFNSGYHANVGILPALAGKNDLIIADKYVHASIIDGINLSRAEMIRYRHLDYAQLREILFNKCNDYENVFIVSESIFSMDGDIADLHALIDIRNEYQTFLYIDEAHAIGVRGLNGLGCCEEQVCMQDIDFIVGTFGKALASLGAYCICDEIFADYLINSMRTLIYTTALPSINVAWTDFIFNKLPSLNQERDNLKYLSDKLRVAIKEMGYKTMGNSHIVPLITGTNESSVKLSNYLQDNDIFALPVRHPTVPQGTARIRFSLSARMEEWQIDQLIEIIRNYSR